MVKSNNLRRGVMKNPGIKDVAEKAGVSVTTVSRVLNKRGYISKEMYQKVHKAIEEIDFHPNQIARSLTKQRTNTVGFPASLCQLSLFCSVI